MRLVSKGCDPNCPEWIAAFGAITDQTPAKLTKLLSNPAYRKLPIILQSHGGRIAAALAMGRVIRKYRMNTAIAGSSCWSDGDCQNSDDDKVHPGFAVAGRGYCNSACPFMLLGGVVRIADPTTHIGVHQSIYEWRTWTDHYWDTWKIVNGKKIITSHKFTGRTYTSDTLKAGIDPSFKGTLLTYIKDMGGSPDILDEMMKAVPKEINEIESMDKRKALGFVTDTGLTVSNIAGVTHCSGDDALKSNCVTIQSDAPQVATAVPAPAPDTKSSPIAIPAPANADEPEMTFTVFRLDGRCEPRCPEWIVAYGRISNSTPSRLEQLLSDPERRKLPIMLWSHGGSIDGAIAMGRIIHGYGMDTMVSGSASLGCSSYDKGFMGCRLLGDALVRTGFPVEANGYCQDACSVALLAGGVRIAASGAIVSLPHLSADMREPFEQYLLSTGRTFEIVRALNSDVSQGSNISDQSERVKLGLVTSAGLTVQHLIGPDQCATYANLFPNCIDAGVLKPKTQGISSAQ